VRGGAGERARIGVRAADARVRCAQLAVVRQFAPPLAPLLTPGQMRASRALVAALAAGLLLGLLHTPLRDALVLVPGSTISGKYYFWNVVTFAFYEESLPLVRAASSPPPPPPSSPASSPLTRALSRRAC
jgi:hypothetical protein